MKLFFDRMNRMNRILARKSGAGGILSILSKTSRHSLQSAIRNPQFFPA